MSVRLEASCTWMQNIPATLMPERLADALQHLLSRLTLAAFLWQRYLRADYRILVKPPGEPYDRTYLQYFPPGVVFMVIFAVLVPAAYFLVLYFLRHRLQVLTSMAAPAQRQKQSIENSSSY
jgi:hypothetical protein